MKVGLTTGFGTVGRPEDVAAFVRHAEDVGFESLWLTEHVVVPVEHAPTYPYSPDGRLPIGADADLPDPLTWLAFAAAHTSTILLGPACLVLPLHRPAVVAKQAATVDRLSDGRLRLGVGLGWMEEEALAVGSPWAGRGRRVDEGIDELRAYWSGAASARSLPAPEGGTIPVHVCGPSEAAVRRAAVRGDGWFCGHRDPSVVAGRLAVLDVALADAGRTRADVEVTTGAPPRAATLDALAALGVDRVFFTLPCRDPDRDRTALDKLATLIPR